MFDKAVLAFNESITLCPTDFRSYLLRAEAHKGMCKTQQRVDDLIGALLYAPTNKRAFVEFSKTVKISSHYRHLLLKTLLTAHKLHPFDAEICFQLGHVLFLIGTDQEQELVKRLDRTERLRQLKLKAGDDWTDANEAELVELLSEYPETPETYYAKSMAFARRTLSLPGGSKVRKGAHCLNAALLEREGAEKRNDTIDALLRCVEASTEKVDEFPQVTILRTLGILQRGRNDLKGALHSFEMANAVIESHPYNFVAERVSLLGEMGKDKEARELAASMVRYFSGIAGSGEVPLLQRLVSTYKMKNFDNEESVRAGKELKRRMGRTGPPPVSPL
mmetsp:Transcript_28860/g.74021  ORF Transcript_28860/g.74021 Transcript_28860/m.74021 type:complete len:334 (+) Transcript_28860:1662-2663(+)